MEKSDYNYYLAIISKIVMKNIDPELCGYCYPKHCEEYTLKLFGKNIEIDFVYSHNLINIYSKYDMTRFNIIFDMDELKFYQNNIDLLK